jgi:hypothetical protein
MSDGKVRIDRWMECAYCGFEVHTAHRVPFSSTQQELDDIWHTTLIMNGWRQRPKHRFSKKLRWYCEAHA